MQFRTTRLIAAALLLALMTLIAVSAVLALSFRRTTANRQDDERRHEREGALVEALSADSARTAIDLREHLLTGRKRDLAELEAGRAAVRAGLGTLAQQRPNDPALEQLAEHLVRLDEAADRAIAARAADREEAARLFEREVQPHRAAVDALLERAGHDARLRFAESHERSNESTLLAFRWLAVSISAALVFAAAVGAFLVRSLRQLDRAREQLEQRVAERTADLQTANSRLAVLATRDNLTGAWNRASFDQKLLEECTRADRYGLPLTLVMVDIDHFKAINDTYGHPAGDEAIRRVAQLISTALRQTDFLARYGGEEFAILLVNTDRRGAEPVAERLREHVAGAEWRHRSITVSVGVASWTPSARTPEMLLAAADEALYRSKSAGRNRVTLAEPPPADA